MQILMLPTNKMNSDKIVSGHIVPRNVWICY